MQGIHTSHRDVVVGMARSMIGLSQFESFLGCHPLDKFYELLSHYAVSNAYTVNPGRSVCVLSWILQCFDNGACSETSLLPAGFS